MPFVKGDKYRKTHGMSGTKIYNIWTDMRRRCNNENRNDYKNYGCKNIHYCDCTDDFQNFYNYVSELPNFGENGYTLDRIDNNGLYCICKHNLRWADRITQNHNKGARHDSKTRYSGVQILPSGRFRVTITSNYKTINLGCYGTLEEAIEARQQGESLYWK